MTGSPKGVVFLVFFTLGRGGQEGSRHKCRKRLIRLAHDFGFRWFARYTFRNGHFESGLGMRLPSMAARGMTG